MKKLTTYFVSLANYEFKKEHGEYPSSMWEKGSVWSSDYLDEEVEGVFTSLKDAKAALADCGNAGMRDYGKYFRIEEYAIKERVYNLSEIYEDYEGEIVDEDDFIVALEKNPWDFNEYEIMEESEDIYDFSPRKFTVEVTYETGNREEKSFNEYSDAKEYLEMMLEESSVEDAEIEY